jgi:ADP-ribose pyrophosphatase YjhB (NUDIX family)
MNRVRDTFCSYCGTAYAAPLAYPRKCPNAACAVEVWSNPIPVAVALVPIARGGQTGLLVIRRAIEPRPGMLALVGGFAEDHETWQGATAREVREEAGVTIDPARLEPFWFVSTEPKPNRVLLFSVAAALDGGTLPPLVPNHEVSERGAVFGPDGLGDVFAFALHVRAAERWFASRGSRGPHAYAAF